MLSPGNEQSTSAVHVAAQPAESTGLNFKNKMKEKKRRGGVRALAS